MTKRIFTLLFSIAGLIFFSGLTHNNSYCQAKVTSALIRPDTSASYKPYMDTLQIEFGSMKLSDEKQAKSGSLAMLLSAILPGSGQVYAHRYFTIPLIWGFGYYFYSQYKIADSDYGKYRSLYTQSLTDSTLFSRQFEFKTLRENRHNFRDEMGVYLALTYLLNIIDAYVGATLYDFSVSDELGGSSKIQFRIPVY